MRERLRLHIAGRGGDGNITLGEILGKVLARQGYHVFSFRTYPAEIEGGVAQIALNIGVDPVLSLGSGSNLAAVLANDAMDEVRGELSSDAFVLHDQTVRKIDPFRGLSIEATKTARWTFGNPKLKNLIMLGALARLMGLRKPDVLNAAVERMKKIERDVIAETIAHGATLAAEYEGNFQLAPPRGKPQMILTGNQAVGLGAIKAGCEYVAGYPITPASPLLEYLARALPGFGGTVVQTEDEIAAIGSCLGASYAGKKTLTPTSGPGFALMSEMINLGVMAELPVVIVDVQRAGPSTGMPSKTEQGDLLHALFGSPGESPRVVLAASDVRDAYKQTIRAFNLAEALQLPVILLSDQALAYRQETLDADFADDHETVVARRRMNGVLPEEFKRFVITENGVSPSAIPGGTDYPHMITGLEHDEWGRESYTPDVHRAMTEKRHRKLVEAERLAELHETDFDKPEEARLGVLGWGSTRGMILETVQTMNPRRKMARMHLHTLRPLPEKTIREFAQGLDRLIVVEENFSGQLAVLLQGIVDCDVVSVTKCEGLPFETGELIEKMSGKI